MDSISLKYVHDGAIYDKSVLIQHVMIWLQTGNLPFNPTQWRVSKHLWVNADDVTLKYTSDEVDSLTVSLHNPIAAGNLPAVRAAHGNSQWPLIKDLKFPPVTRANNPLRQRQAQPIFRPTNHTEWCQPIVGHVPYPTDSPTATRLGLCSSLRTRTFITACVDSTNTSSVLCVTSNSFIEQ